MTLVLDAVAEPTNTPPRVKLTVTESVSTLALQSVSLFRDGVPLRFDPVLSGGQAIAYDYDAPFDVASTYRADVTELNTAPEWTESWAGLGSWLSPPAGGAATGWSVAAGVASSTAADAIIYRDTTTAITRVDVTAPSNMTLQLVDSSSGDVLGFVKLTPDGMVTLSGSAGASQVVGSGAYSLFVSADSLSVVGTGWSTQVAFTGTPKRVRLVAPPAFSFLAKYATTGTNPSSRGIAFDSSGNFYVAVDYVGVVGGRIQKFNSSGVFQSEFGASGTGTGQFDWPHGIAVDASNNIWVVDRGRNKVLKFNSSGVFQAEYSSSLSNPTDIAFDSSGNFWVTDADNNRVVKFNSSGVYQSQFGTSGTGNGQFSGPHGIAIDASNNMWVTDFNNNRVQKFNSSGVYQSQFGPAPGGTGAGQFNGPVWVAVDTSGNTYVTDHLNHRVQKFNSSGVFVAQVGGYGSGDAQFNYPTGISVRSTGDVFVVDGENDRVQKFVQTGGSVDDITVLGSGTLTQASVSDVETLAPTGDMAGCWLTNALQPDLAILVERVDCSGGTYHLVTSTRATTELEDNTVQLRIEGSPRIVTAVTGPREEETWTLDVACTTEAARKALLAALANSAAILLRFPPSLNYLGLASGFYAVGRVATRRATGPAVSELATVSLPLTPSDPPAYKPLWQWNLRTLAQTGMTLRDVNNTYASLRDLLLGPPA